MSFCHVVVQASDMQFVEKQLCHVSCGPLRRMLSLYTGRHESKSAFRNGGGRNWSFTNEYEFLCAPSHSCACDQLMSPKRVLDLLTQHGACGL